MTEKSKKKRISTLAKLYKVSNEVLLGLLKDAEVTVKSAASMIDSDTFAKIKPALLKEKERLERKEMAEAGLKIPMKAVLKKSAVIKKKTEKPAAIIKPPSEEKPIAPPEPEEAKKPIPKKEPPKTEKAKAPAATQAPKKKPAPAKAPKQEAPAPESAKSAEVTKPVKEIPPKQPALKVVVEKPDRKLTARIQKYMTDKILKKSGDKSDKGYSGRFGKVPATPVRVKIRSRQTVVPQTIPTVLVNDRSAVQEQPSAFFGRHNRLCLTCRLGHQLNT